MTLFAECKEKGIRRIRLSGKHKIPVPVACTFAQATGIRMPFARYGEQSPYASLNMAILSY